MANDEHLDILKQGRDAWNRWRYENPGIKPDLSGADLRRRSSSNAVKLYDLLDINLVELSDLELIELTGTRNIGADLRWMNLKEVDLSGSDLRWADLRWAKLNGANLSNAHLEYAHLIDTNLDSAIIKGCSVFGVSTWGIKGKPLDQSDLIITRKGEPIIRVDDLEVAQFIYLLLNREKFRNVIDTLTSKSVLILGRFIPERKVVLDTMANELRKYHLIPIIFDFERATSRDFTETIKILAGLSLFVIADITNPRSIPLELGETVPDYQIPFVPIIEEGEKPFPLFENLQTKYDWVLKTLPYPSLDELMMVFKEAVIDEALEMRNQLLKRKAQKMEPRSIKDYMSK